MQIDYSTGQSFINSFMVDACVVTRDAQDVKDDVLDLNTLKFKRPFNDTVTLYSGNCLVKPASTAKLSDVGGLQIDENMYKLNFPISAPMFRLNDVITMTSVASDLSLLGKVFRIIIVHSDTNRVYRAVYAKDISMFPQQEE